MQGQNCPLGMWVFWHGKVLGWWIYENTEDTYLPNAWLMSYKMAKNSKRFTFNEGKLSSFVQQEVLGTIIHTRVAKAFYTNSLDDQKVPFERFGWSGSTFTVIFSLFKCWIHLFNQMGIMEKEPEIKHHQKDQGIHIYSW